MEFAALHVIAVRNNQSNPEPLPSPEGASGLGLPGAFRFLHQ